MAVETGDIEHAVKKCARNALIYMGHTPSSYIISDFDKVVYLKECLEEIFDDIKKENTRQDVLVKISDILSRT